MSEELRRFALKVTTPLRAAQVRFADRLGRLRLRFTARLWHVRERYDSRRTAVCLAALAAVTVIDVLIAVPLLTGPAREPAPWGEAAARSHADESRRDEGKRPEPSSSLDPWSSSSRNFGGSGRQDEGEPRWSGRRSGSAAVASSRGDRGATSGREEPPQRDARDVPRRSPAPVTSQASAPKPQSPSPQSPPLKEVSRESPSASTTPELQPQPSTPTTTSESAPQPPPTTNPPRDDGNTDKNCGRSAADEGKGARLPDLGDLLSRKDELVSALEEVLPEAAGAVPLSCRG